MFLGSVVGVLVIASILGITRSQTKFNLSAEKTIQKREGKKQVPTFVGSDGVVRKVSPAAILDEMKRCLPPGIPLPPASVWPELPPDLGEAADNRENEVIDNDSGSNGQVLNQNLVKIGMGGLKTSGNNQWKKRVLRSNRNTSGDNAIPDPMTEDMNVRLDVPTKESVIFSPTELNRKTLADILKDVLSKKYHTNGTVGNNGECRKCVEEDFLAGRMKNKYKLRQTDDYENDDYEDEELGLYKHHRADEQQIPLRSRKGIDMKRVRQGRKTKGNFLLNTDKNAHKGRIKLKKIPEYDYDYQESPESDDAPMLCRRKSRGWLEQDSECGSKDELEQQLELNSYLGKLTKRLVEKDEPIVKDKYYRQKLSRIMKASTRIGTGDAAEGYRKMLSVVMELNTNLVRLLEKAIFSSICQKGMTKIGQETAAKADEVKATDDDSSLASSVLLECMDLLVQHRGGRRQSDFREKRDQMLLDSNTFKRDISDQQDSNEHYGRSSSKVSIPKTDLNLLKWLLKWYLSVTSP